MRKIKSSFMIDAHFESILVPHNNVKQNPVSLIQINIKTMLDIVLVIN